MLGLACWFDLSRTTTAAMDGRKISCNANSDIAPPILLTRRRLSTPETIMRKHALAQRRRRSSSQESDRNGSTSDPNLSRRRDADADDIRKSVLIKRFWENSRLFQFPRTYAEWQYSFGPRGKSVSAHTTPEHQRTPQFGNRKLMRKMSVDSTSRDSIEVCKSEDANGNDGKESVDSGNVGVDVGSTGTTEATVRTVDPSETYITYSSNFSNATSTVATPTTTTTETSDSANATGEIKPPVMTYSINASDKQFSELPIRYQFVLRENASGDKHEFVHRDEPEKVSNDTSTQTGETTNLNVISNVHLSESTLNSIFDQVMHDLFRSKPAKTDCPTFNITTIDDSNKPTSKIGVDVAEDKPLMRENKTLLTPAANNTGKSVITEMNAGSPYKAKNSPLVPRLSALPRTSSMEVNASSSNDSFDRESGTVSPVDSLDEPLSPRDARSNHDDKLVRGELALLPDNSANNNAAAKLKKPHSSVFYVPIKIEEEEQEEAETRPDNVSSLFPDRLREKLMRRQAKRQEEKRKREDKMRTFEGLDGESAYYVVSGQANAKNKQPKRKKQQTILPHIENARLKEKLHEPERHKSTTTYKDRANKDAERVHNDGTGERTNKGTDRAYRDKDTLNERMHKNGGKEMDRVHKGAENPYKNESRDADRLHTNEGRDSDRLQKDSNRIHKVPERGYRDTDRRYKEPIKSHHGTDRGYRDTNRAQKDTHRGYKDVNERYKETDRGYKDANARYKDGDRMNKNTDRAHKDPNRRYKDAGGGYNDVNREYEDEDANRMYKDADKGYMNAERIQDSAGVYAGTERMHRDPDRVYKDTDKVHEDTDRGYKNVNRGYKDADNVYKDTNRLHRDADRGFKDTDKMYKDVHKVHEGTDRGYINAENVGNNADRVHNRMHRDIDRGYTDADGMYKHLDKVHTDIDREYNNTEGVHRVHKDGADGRYKNTDRGYKNESNLYKDPRLHKATDREYKDVNKLHEDADRVYNDAGRLHVDEVGGYNDTDEMFTDKVYKNTERLRNDSDGSHGKIKQSNSHWTQKPFSRQYIKHEKSTPVDGKSAQRQIEILEIMEIVEPERLLNAAPKAKSRIPVLVQHKQQKEAVSRVRPPFPDYERENDAKLDQLIANILIDTLHHDESSPEGGKDAANNNNLVETAADALTKHVLVNNNAEKTRTSDDIPKGWITFYMLRANNSPDSGTSDEVVYLGGKKQAHFVGGDRCYHGGGEKEAYRDSDYKSEDYFDSDWELEPRYKQRRLRNEQQEKRGWSVTVSGTADGQQGPDLDLRLKFPQLNNQQGANKPRNHRTDAAFAKKDLSGTFPPLSNKKTRHGDPEI